MENMAMKVPEIDVENQKIVNEIVKLLDGLPLEKARALLRQAEQRSCENAYVMLKEKFVPEDSCDKHENVNPQKCCY